jgi:dihydropteroate synthase
MLTLNCKEKLLSLEKPIVMGIINATRDSFYKSDLAAGVHNLVEMAQNMLMEGASIIDIGGQSTKPGAACLSVQQEIDNVLPVIEAVYKNNPTCIISVDTYNSVVALAAVQAGASIVNDISGGSLDEEMINTVAKFGNVPYVCMHMRGKPSNMQQFTEYDDFLQDMMSYFVEKLFACRNAGIFDVVLDVGFGFAKAAAQNFTLLKHLSLFKTFDCPLLAGISRKSMIYKTLKTDAANALNGTTALHMLALQNGANILRVHDVKAAIECIELFEAYKQS